MNRSWTYLANKSPTPEKQINNKTPVDKSRIGLPALQNKCSRRHCKSVLHWWQRIETTCEREGRLHHKLPLTKYLKLEVCQRINRICLA
ncbi:hypothetical protein AVEN_241359-1 [Araneus ventricosus]|uniref:Uncharacterized protein n=1 Tax=Araneus ventricosus TaxID=182803 RepID=A0A4Y2IF51_ARAVE|nr:hypothetical protein AVEN_241359-1 [Araneus ventricosus]